LDLESFLVAFTLFFDLTNPLIQFLQGVFHRIEQFIDRRLPFL